MQTNSSETIIMDSDDQEIAEYGNSMFIKLKDRDINVTANITFDSSTAIDKSTVQENGIAKPRSINLNFIDIVDAVCLQNILKALEINAPKYTYIQDLNLSNNNIKGEDVKHIISFLETNNKIKKLNLSGNFLNNEIALSALTKTIGNLNEFLQVLILQWNSISGEICTNIIKNLMVRSKSLKILDLSWNNFSNVGKILGQGINQITRLQHLNLSNNPFTDEDIVDILNGLVNTTSLRSLEIKHVFVNEQIEKAISKAQLRVSDCSIKVAVYTGIKIDPEVDMKALYLERIHFLGVIKPKKKDQKIDIGHVLLKMKIEENLEPMKLSLFMSTFGNLKNKAIIELLGDLAYHFRNADTNINIAFMLDKYLELYPDTTLE